MSRRPTRSLLPLVGVLALVLAGAVGLAVARRSTGADEGARTVAAGGAGTRSAADADGGGRSHAARPRRGADWPLSGAAARRARVPILMYHLVADPPTGTPYPALWVPPARFRAQVAALRRAGFTAVTMREAWAAWHGHGRLPRRPVVLSFDDGDLSQARNAGPVLRRLGWPGVLNLAVNHLGPDDLPVHLARALLRQGWEIDSHTVHHLDVTTLDAAGLRREITGSRAALRRKLGIDARFFCYPAGRHDAASEAAVKAAGYEAATTVAPGIATRSDDPFVLPRIRVDPTTAPSTLVAQAKGRAAAPAGGPPA